jgi:hypothetical protein
MIDMFAKVGEKLGIRFPIASMDRLHPEFLFGIEILRRFSRLKNGFSKLENINQHLMATSPQGHFVLENSDTLTLFNGLSKFDVTLKRGNPLIPVTFEKVASGGVYVPQPTTADLNLTDDDLKSELEDMLENYYYNAHRVLKLVKKLKGMKNFKCAEISIVRNKLIEHANDGELYSFGWGTEGPKIRPLRRANAEWKDEGLFKNTEQFLKALNDQLAINS